MQKYLCQLFSLKQTEESQRANGFIQKWLLNQNGDVDEGGELMIYQYSLF